MLEWRRLIIWKSHSKKSQSLDLILNDFKCPERQLYVKDTRLAHRLAKNASTFEWNHYRSYLSEFHIEIGKVCPPQVDHQEDHQLNSILITKVRAWKFASIRYQFVLLSVTSKAMKKQTGDRPAILTACGVASPYASDRCQCRDGHLNGERGAHNRQEVTPVIGHFHRVKDYCG